MSTENATPVAATRGISLENLAAGIARVSNLESINARLAKHGLPQVEDLNTGAVQLARASGVKSQGDVAVLVVNLTGGRVQADDLTKILAAAFPGSKVGERHGPHYLSLARTGKLKGVEIEGTIAHRARKKANGAVIEVKTQPVEIKSDGAEHLALMAATGVEIADKVHEAAKHDALMSTNDLKAELEALSQKDLAARAKAVGIKAVGEKDAIIKGILAVS